MQTKERVSRERASRVLQKWVQKKNAGIEAEKAMQRKHIWRQLTGNSQHLRNERRKAETIKQEQLKLKQQCLNESAREQMRQMRARVMRERESREQAKQEREHAELLADTMRNEAQRKQQLLILRDIE